MTCKRCGRRAAVGLALFVLLMCAAPAVGRADEAADAKEPPSAADLQAQIVDLQQQILRLQQESLAELREIRRLLQEQRAQPSPGARVLPPRPGAAPAPPPEPVTVSASVSPALGKPDAPVTIVEFTDYQCPFCARFHEEVFPLIKHNYVETGKVRWVSRELPLAMHHNAYRAALAAQCAARQEQFWAMRTIMFANQEHLEPADLQAYALTLNLNSALFDACLAAEATKPALARDTQDAAVAGIHSTPTFVIGPTEPGSTTITGLPLVGAQPYSAFAAQIDAVLAQRAGD